MHDILKEIQLNHYPEALRLLKKKYYIDHYNPNLYLLFYFVYKKLKKNKKSIFWLKKGFFLLPEFKKIAQLYAYQLVIHGQTTQAIYPIYHLIKNKMIDSFTYFITSKYYYKTGDLEKSMLFAKMSFSKSKRKFHYRWYLFLLYKYRRVEKLITKNKYQIVRKLLGSLEMVDLKGNISGVEYIFLKNFSIVHLNNKLLKSDLFQYWLYKKFKIILPHFSFLTKLKILKESGENISQLFNKKKEKNWPLKDENLIKVVAIIAILILLYYILRGVF